MSLEVTGGSISEVLPGHGPVLSVARLGHESVLFFSAATWFIGAGSSLRGSFSRPTPLSDTRTLAEHVIFPQKELNLLAFGDVYLLAQLWAKCWGAIYCYDSNLQS